MYVLKSPYVELPNEFELLEDAYYACMDLLKQRNSIKFISIYHYDDNKTKLEIINTFVKPGYQACTFTMFKHMDYYNGISDYFILHKDGHDTYFIKPKKL
jgi:hypothetical protein